MEATGYVKVSGGKYEFARNEKGQLVFRFCTDTGFKNYWHRPTSFGIDCNGLAYCKLFTGVKIYITDIKSY